MSDNPAVGSVRGRFLSPWDVVRVARIGLMASHLWLFFLAVALAGSGTSPAFWVGALYVTVPLGMLIYGWNDFFDADVDSVSRRKRETRVSGFFGYRLSPAKRRLLPAYIVALHLPFLALAAAFGELWTIGWLAVMALGNWLYNGPGVRLSRKPLVAELTASWIYLNILWLSVSITGLRQPWPVWALAVTAVLAFQVGGAIVDIESDRKVGKITLAAKFGETAAAWVLAAVVAAKALLCVVALSAVTPAALNLAAIPFLLARPKLRKFHWAGVAYVYFIVVDWLALAWIAV